MNLIDSLVTTEKERHASPFLIVLLVTILAAVPAFIYYQGLPGGFEFDDGINIVKNEHIRLTSLDIRSVINASLSTNSGPLRRPISMLSFALNYYFVKESITGYKLVNISIHIINTLLVFVFAIFVLKRVQFTQSLGVVLSSFGIALLWSLLPINLTSVLYVVQRMVSLGGTFALLSFLCWFKGRQIVELRAEIPFVWGFLFLVSWGCAVLCKETYALIGLSIVLLDWILFTRANVIEKALWRFQIVVLIVMIGFVAFLLIHSKELVVGDYSQRPFTMYERLLTQSRVLLFYISQIIFPSNLFLGLYHDDFPISRGILDPLSTFVCMVVVLALIAYSFRERKKNKLLSLGVMWFFCWHILESTMLSLELVHEHRNYIASIGLVLVGRHYFSRLKDQVATKLVTLLVLLGVFFLNGSVTLLRALEWNNLVSHALAEVDHHPNSVRAKYQLGRIYLMMYYRDHDDSLLALAEEAFLHAAQLTEYDMLPWFGVIRAKILQGEEIDEAINTLSQKLEYSKIPASTLVALSDLQECIKASECGELQSYYLELLDGLLRNSSLNEKSLSQLYSLKASFYAEILDDYERAYAVLKEGVGRLPKDYMLRKSILYYFVIKADYHQVVQLLADFRVDFMGRSDAEKIYFEICEILEIQSFDSKCEINIQN